MNDLRVTIKRITWELNTLMRELSGADDTQARILIEEMAKSDLTAEFKASVDAMRNLLWIYVEAVSRTHRGQPNDLVRSKRLQSAVEMLRSLHRTNVPEQFSDTGTFFDHIQHIVDDYGEDRPIKKKTSDAA